MASSMRRVAVAATVGTVIEWYDFFLYNTAAALVFGKLFFPSQDATVGTLLAFATSATGFVARPLGAVVCGHFGDRVGRKAMLLVTLLSMGGATVGIGLLPGYDSIGLLAPVALVVLRLVQGFAAGGEWGGAALMTVEHATSRRGFWGSLITTGIMLGLVLSSLAFAALGGLSETAFLSWGWRLPFLASAALVIVGLYIRLKVSESPEFVAATARGERARAPLAEALRQPRNILVIFLLRVAENFSFYIMSAFSLAYVTRTLGLPRSLALNAVLIAAVAEAVSAIGIGSIVDRIGARAVVTFGVAFQMVFAFAFFAMLQTGSPPLVILAVVIGFAICNGCISGPSPTFFAQFFKARVRFSGIAIGRETATILGGGLAPLIATALLSWSGSIWPVAACMAFTSFLGLIGLYVGRSVGRSPAVETAVDARMSGLAD